MLYKGNGVCSSICGVVHISVTACMGKVGARRVNLIIFYCVSFIQAKKNIFYTPCPHPKNEEGAIDSFKHKSISQKYFIIMYFIVYVCSSLGRVWIPSNLFNSATYIFCISPKSGTSSLCYSCVILKFSVFCYAYFC